MVALIVVTALAWHFLCAGRSGIEAPMRREIEGCPKRAGTVGGDRVIEGDGAGPEGSFHAQQFQSIATMSLNDGYPSSHTFAVSGGGDQLTGTLSTHCGHSNIYVLDTCYC